jgi:hypothetical protein
MEANQGFEGTREEVERAIRRLNVLEYAILGAAVVLALAGGALAAYVLSSVTALSFRLTWPVASLLFLAVPGFIVFGRDEDRRGARSDGSDGRPGTGGVGDDGR